jgi:acyl carrier protein
MRMSMLEFDAKVKELVWKMEDLAGVLFDDDNIQEYFVEAYDFDEYNAMGALIKYIEDRYID